MAEERKVIITCAVTGAIHTPSMSKALPVTAQEIADAAIGAAEAGSAIVHLHARNPETGQPDQTPEAFAPFLKVIKQRSNCVVNLTTGGAPTMRVEERVRPAAVYKPEVASLNMGSMNFGLFGMLNRFKDFKHEWERQYLGNKDIIFRNTYQDIEYVLRTLSDAGTRFEFECYDTAHLYNLNYFLEQGLVAAKLMPGNEIQNLKRRASDVIVDPNARFKDNLYNGDSIYYQTRRIVGSAQKTVDICTPYIFLPRNERDCLKKWVSEVPGRKVRIISNSAATSDSALAMATFDKETAPELMKSGDYACIDPKTNEIATGHFDNSDHKIEVWELGRLNNLLFADKGKKGWAPVRDSKGNVVELTEHYGKLHSKFGIVDGKFALVGSANFDMRSRHLNSETTFFIDSEQVARDLTSEFDKLVSRSYLYGDPDLEIMTKRPEIWRRVKAMEVFGKLNKWAPKTGFGN